MGNTITSLAVLKVLADSDRRDFLENFIPFLKSLLIRRADTYAAGFDVIEICAGIADEFGLYIPYHPIRALLARATKRGFVRRDHGKYFINSDSLGEDRLTKISEEQQATFRNIEQAFQNFAKTKYGKEYSSEQATGAVLAFLKRSDLDLLISAKNRSVLPAIGRPQREEFIFSDFVSEVYSNQPDVYTYLVGLAFGHILANIIVNPEIKDFAGRFRHLCIYLDTRLVLLALGLDSEEYRDAYVEFLTILKAQGASLFIFDHTRDEIDSILEGCRVPLRQKNIDPDRVSRVCLTLRYRGYTESELDWQLAQLETELRRLGIEVTPAPDPRAHHLYQVDEVKLRDLIVKAFQKSRPHFDEFARGTIIDRDLRSISSIYRLRKGNAPRRLTEARHIFITTNTSLARAAVLFERIEYGRHRKIPTCLTDVFVGTLAWLNSPNEVYRLNYKKLVADCYAAIEPSAELLRRIATEAERLRQKGQIQYDDYLLIRNDKVARRLLAQKTLGDPDLLNNQVIEEVLGLIKKRLTDEAWKRTREETERRVDAERRYNELQRQVMERNQRLSSKLERVSTWVAIFIASIFACGVLLGPLVHLFGSKEWLGIPAPIWDLLSFILLVLALLGFSDFKNVRRRASKAIFSFLYQKLINLID